MGGSKMIVGVIGRPSRCNRAARAHEPYHEGEARRNSRPLLTQASDPKCREEEIVKSRLEISRSLSGIKQMKCRGLITLKRNSNNRQRIEVICLLVFGKRTSRRVMLLFMNSVISISAFLAFATAFLSDRDALPYLTIEKVKIKRCRQN